MASICDHSRTFDLDLEPPSFRRYMKSSIVKGSSMSAHRHGQERALASLWKCKVFLCISGYSKTLSRRIIYALFSQPVVGFWGRRDSIPGSRWGTFVPIPLFAHSWKKFCRRPWDEGITPLFRTFLSSFIWLWYILVHFCCKMHDVKRANWAHLLGVVTAGCMPAAPSSYTRPSSNV